MATIIYHHIGDGSSPFINRLDITTSADEFKKQLEHFAKTKVEITFDDGYSSAFEVALPLLQEFQIPATFYLNLAALTSGTSWLNKLSYLINTLSDGHWAQFSRDAGVAAPARNVYPFWKFFDYPKTLEAIEKWYSGPATTLFMDRKQILELASDPLFKVGSHSRNHWPLHRIPRELIHDEVVAHHHDLEKYLGIKPSGFSIPFGLREDATDNVIKCASQIDDCLRTSFGGKAFSNPLLPEKQRIGISDWARLGTLLSAPKLETFRERTLPFGGGLRPLKGGSQ